MAEVQQQPSNLPRIVPERIKEAREAKGYTRETFAEALGVTVQAIGQYETGLCAPGPEVMKSIIGLSEQPPVFFTVQRQRIAERTGMPFWRSLERMKRPDRLRVARRLEWCADIVRYVEQFIELPPVQLPAVAASFHRIDAEALEQAAENLRAAWDLGELPIAHLAATLETKGIVLIKEPVNCEDMDAVSQWQGGRPYILVAEDKYSLLRENFDLAHELAHLVFHSHIELGAPTLPSLERQANYFAGAFLMPRRTFPKEIVSTSLSYFAQLKTRWRVSVQAMVYRCKDLGILNKNQVAYLWRQMSEMRRREPVDVDLTPERPTILAAALNMLIENGVQSRAQIVEALKLNPTDIERLCGTRSGFLDPKVIQLNLRARQ